MLPVLEDPVLARRASEGRYSVRDLLLYSTVCGTGLDVVPLPGDTAADRLAALDRKSTRLNSSHLVISYAVFCLKKKKKRDNVSISDCGKACVCGEERIVQS